MRIKRKNWMSLFLGGLLILSCVGCGGKTPASSDSSVASSEAASSESTLEEESSVPAQPSSTVSEKQTSSKLGGSSMNQSKTPPVTTSTAVSSQVKYPLPGKPEDLSKKTTEIGAWYSTWYANVVPDSTNNAVNTWTAWNIPYKVLLPDGSFGHYDSGDTDVINFHLKKMAEAQIDFIVMDQTNHIDVDGGYINKRSLAVAKAIKKWNDTPGHRPVKYCSAIGGVQWDKTGQSIEDEAKKIWYRYIETDFGSSDYHYYYNGKPVLVIYRGNIPKSVWDNYTGDKTYGNKFTIRWADNTSAAGNWGWAYTETKYHWETTMLMPGWNNKVSKPVNRDDGKHYKESWDVVLNAPKKPRILLINSFNEYAERTSIFPAMTEGLPADDQWSDGTGKLDPYMYWNMTVDYIKKFKAQSKPLDKPYV